MWLPAPCTRLLAVWSAGSARLCEYDAFFTDSPPGATGYRRETRREGCIGLPRRDRVAYTAARQLCKQISKDQLARRGALGAASAAVRPRGEL